MQHSIKRSFPLGLLYCQWNRKTVKRTVHKAYKITMGKVESNIKAAAEKKNDIERLGQFRGVDLIAKELMTQTVLFRIHSLSRRQRG